MHVVNTKEKREMAYINVRVPIVIKERAIQCADKNQLSISDIVRLSLVAELAEIESGKFNLRGGT